MKQVTLTQGQFALVDDDDYKRVMEHKWSARRDPKSGTWYAMTNIKRDGKYHSVLLHRFILGLSPSTPIVDHADGNGLNCQRKNLRICTPSQNQLHRGPQKHNKSGARGVYWDAHLKQWRATITVNGERLNLGSSKSLNEAIEFRRTYEMEFFPEFTQGISDDE